MRVKPELIIIEKKRGLLRNRLPFTVPRWFKEYNKAWSDPEHYLGDTPLGAVVVCPETKDPSFDQAINRVTNESNWRMVEVH
jgi:hypothetical protein